MLLQAKIFHLWSYYVILGMVHGDQIDTCDFKATKLQICDGSKDYLKTFPSTYNGESNGKTPLEIQPILTFLKLAMFDDQEKSVTVFVSLMMRWNDTRLSLSTDRYGLERWLQGKPFLDLMNARPPWVFFVCKKRQKNHWLDK